MAMETRNPTEEELRPAMQAGAASFGDQQKEEDFEREKKLLPLERFLAAYDDGSPIATAAAYAFDLTIPGGQLPAAGVTWVGVQPSHRRRGVMSAMMRQQIQDVHDRGEPLAILWASEAAIYGRFGYGLAAPALYLEAERARFRLR